MIYLFVHQNFPGQYRHIARELVRTGNTVYFLTRPNANEMPGIEKLVYRVPIIGRITCHPLTTEIDTAIRSGCAVADFCRKLRDQGFRPDVMIGHGGWGETLFLKDVFPDAPLLTYFEFYYHFSGVDVGFDSEFVSVFSEPARIRTRNAISLMAFDAADWGNSPTNWQRSLYPPEMRPRISVLHEGVNTNVVCPKAKAQLELTNPALRLSSRDEVITYVARNLEPYRGFHIFMRALPEVLRRRPKAQVVIVGGDEVSYGMRAPPQSTFREMMLQELQGTLDLQRVHFLGRVDYTVYLTLLQISSVHIYLTYPFVLSWSFIEAMASGCLIVGSATPPVQEVMQDRVNGLLVDFFSVAEVSDRIIEALENRKQMKPLRQAARETAVSRFDLHSRQLPRWKALFDALVAGERPALDFP